MIDLSEVADMTRTLPKPEFRCATCGECFDDQDLHWVPMRTSGGRVTFMEGWHCPYCDPSVPHERITLDKFREAIR